MLAIARNCAIGGSLPVVPLRPHLPLSDSMDVRRSSAYIPVAKSSVPWHSGQSNDTLSARRCSRRGCFRNPSHAVAARMRRCRSMQATPHPAYALPAAFETKNPSKATSLFLWPLGKRAYAVETKATSIRNARYTAPCAVAHGYGRNGIRQKRRSSLPAYVVGRGVCIPYFATW